MSHQRDARFIQPTLEALEDRDLPSILLSDAIDLLLQPMRHMIDDLNIAMGPLRSAQAALVAEQGNPTPANVVAENFATAAAYYQRILNDQHAIAATSATDLAFVTAISLIEFQNGDPIDLFLVEFGPLFGFFQVSSLSGPASTADSIIHLPSVQDMVNQSYTNLGPAGATFNLPSIASQVTAPQF
jgi:hypothetical protein